MMREHIEAGLAAWAGGNITSRGIREPGLEGFHGFLKIGDLGLKLFNQVMELLDGSDGHFGTFSGIRVDGHIHRTPEFECSEVEL